MEVSRTVRYPGVATGLADTCRGLGLRETVALAARHDAVQRLHGDHSGTLLRLKGNQSA